MCCTSTLGTYLFTAPLPPSGRQSSRCRFIVPLANALRRAIERKKGACASSSNSERRIVLDRMKQMGRGRHEQQQGSLYNRKRNFRSLYIMLFPRPLLCVRLIGRMEQTDNSSRGNPMFSTLPSRGAGPRRLSHNHVPTQECVDDSWEATARESCSESTGIINLAPPRCVLGAFHRDPSGHKGVEPVATTT